MKKIILLSFLAILSSCKSNEEKALALIDREMFKTLYDYESYEPVETIITDSAFTSIYQDSTIRHLALKMIAIGSLIDEQVKEGYEALERAEQYIGNTYLSYKYDKYMNKAKEVRDKVSIYRIMYDNTADSIALLAKDYPREFIGWKINHKFRCKNKGGNFSIGDHTYIVDEKFKKIIYTEDNDDDNMKKIRSNIRNAVKPNKSLSE